MNHRKPRKGELNYELEKMFKRLLKEDRSTIPFILPLVEEHVTRLVKKFGITEFEVEYNRSASIARPKSWIVDGVMVIAFRKRPNGSIAIHRAGVTRWPPPQKSDPTLANLNAKKLVHVYSFVDEKYSWDRLTVLKPRKSLVKKWNKR